MPVEKKKSYSIFNLDGSLKANMFHFPLNVWMTITFTFTRKWASTPLKGFLIYFE